MKYTREQLHYFIDSHPKEMSTDEIVISLACSYLMRRPEVIPQFIQNVSSVLSEITNRFLELTYLAKERAWYLETYLNGDMYSPEYNDTEEAKGIQKEHATIIKNKCHNILEGKWYE